MAKQKATASQSLIKDSKSFFVTEIAWLVFSSTDMIIIAILLSTSMASVYSIYNMVFLALSTLLSSIYNSMNYILGQKYQEGIETYSKYHDLFNSFFMAGITMLMSVAYILVLPFVKMYTNGVTDIEYINPYLPVLFCLVQILSWSRYVAGNMTGLSGYAKFASKLSILEASVHIALSLAFGITFGLSGVLLGSVCALPIKVIVLNYIAEKKVLCRAKGKTWKILLVNYMVFIATVVGNNFFDLQITSYLQWCVYAVCLVVIYTTVIAALNSIANSDFRYILCNGVSKIIKNVLRIGDTKVKTVMLVFGTRPEAIKMCPLVNELKTRENIKTVVCVTGQHRQMLDMVLDTFNVIPDYDLSIMKQGQTLFDITTNILNRIGDVLDEVKPDVVLVHGDTSTTFVTALACFYKQIAVGHVEAGLRTYNIYSPYPEEFNRQAVSIISKYNFAPTELSKSNLVKEGKDESSIYITGNTAIDALKTTVREGLYSSGA